MRIIKWILILLLVIIVGGIAFLFTLDLNSYKETIQTQAKSALGRDLAIDGDIGLALSLTPSISIEGLRLANVEGATPADMITVGRVEAQMEILPLLQREVRIKRLVLADADIHLQADDQGGGNWVFGEAAAEEEETASSGDPIIPFLGDVLVQNVNVTYVDPAGQEYRVGVDEATVKADSIDSPVALTLAGTVQDEVLNVSGSTGSIQHLLDKQPDWAFDLSAELAGATATLNGAIADTATFGALGADVTAEVADAARVAGLAGVTDLGPVPAVSLNARVDQDGDIIALSALSGLIGDASLDGNLTAKLGGAVPAVQGALNFGDLDFDALLPASDDAAPAETSSDGRLIPDVPLPLDGLLAADADIAITANSITASGATISDLATDISLSGGALDLVLSSATLFEGALTGGVKADAAAQSVGLDIDFASFNLGTMLSSQGVTDLLTGTGNVAVDFAGAAGDLRGLLAVGQGSLGFDMDDGTLNTDKFGAITKSLMQLLLPGAPAGGVIALNCAVVGYDIADGSAVTNGILFDTPLFSAVSAGSLDLTAETMDMLAKASVPLSPAVKLTGPWTTPSVAPSIDAEALAGNLTGGLVGGGSDGLRVPDVGDGSDGQNECIAALANPTYTESEGTGLGDIGDTVQEVIENPESLLEGAGEQLLDSVTGGDSDGEGGGLGDALKDALPGGAGSLFGN